MKITADNLKRIETPAGSERTFWDDDIRGFGVRVRSSGARSFIFWYRLRESGEQRKFTIPLPVEPKNVRPAREKAADMWAAVRQGNDPQAAKIEDRKNAGVTFKATVDEYFEHKDGKVKPRTLDEYKRYLRGGKNVKHCQSLQGLRLDKITRGDLADALAKVERTSGPVAKARAYAALSDFFGWAVGTKCAIDVNPLATINRPETSEVRERILKADELAAIWNACEEDDFGRIVRLLILTLQRRNEIGEMEHPEIDKEESTFTIAPERTKNSRVHKVPLVRAALDLIEASPARKDKNEKGAQRRTVFGQGKGGFSGWSKAKAALDDRITEAHGKALAHWTLHDLRRTGHTMMGEELGITPHVREAILNHISTIESGKQGVGKVYDKATYFEERKMAHGLWADFVLALASGKTRKIVPLRRA
jgi:integrase